MWWYYSWISTHGNGTYLLLVGWVICSNRNLMTRIKNIKVGATRARRTSFPIPLKYCILRFEHYIPLQLLVLATTNTPRGEYTDISALFWNQKNNNLTKWHSPNHEEASSSPSLPSPRDTVQAPPPFHMKNLWYTHVYFRSSCLTLTPHPHTP